MNKKCIKKNYAQHRVKFNAKFWLTYENPIGFSSWFCTCEVYH